MIFHVFSVEAETQFLTNQWTQPKHFNLKIELVDPNRRSDECCTEVAFSP